MAGTWAYVAQDGEVIRETYPPGSQQPQEIVRNGKRYEIDWGLTFERSNFRGTTSSQSGEYWSDALGVAPEQIPEAAAELRRAGVRDVEFHPETGQYKVRGRQHRNQTCKALGFYDKDAGYGDVAPGDTQASQVNPETPEYI